MATVFRERDAWVVKFKNAAGRWQKRRTDCGTKAEAKLYAQQLEHRAERQRNGLEPLEPTVSLTFGELLAWYDKHHAHRVKSQHLRLSVGKHLDAELHGVPLVDVTSARLEALLSEKSKTLSAETINHLRSFAHRLFALATRADLWTRPNPVARVPRMKVPRRPPSWLRPEEVTAVIPQVPERWRALFATAVFTGMRRGELVALQKRDVDLASEKPSITVCRSWDSDTTKGGEVRVIPVHPELAPFLASAVASSRSELVFPRPDGSMHTEHIDLASLLRNAMARAGLVKGYVHKCRWCGHESKVLPDAEPRRCPEAACGKKLWPSAVKRTERFHDLRHTTATLLLKAGTPLAVVQRLVGHSDPAITTEIYGHLEAEDARPHIERLSFSFPVATVAEVLPMVVNAPRGLPVVPLAERTKDEGPDSVGFRLENQGLPMVGATGFEPA
ncbi:MAG: site-specific integrase, partial [Myxococcaceae bacterium]|nr:site-specific integrase [Myxococcaceae bacterium]